jgi:hypothetical protein
MSIVDPNDVFVHPKDWKEISRQSALLSCEFKPVVAVYNTPLRKRADRVSIGAAANVFGIDFHASGTKFYQKIDADEASATQLANKQKLIAAQDAARSNTAFMPSAGVTHCNQATTAIASAVGAPTGPIAGELANTVAANLAASSLYSKVAVDQVQDLANTGALVIAAWSNPNGHGHLATVRPLGVDGDKPAAGRGPLLNNVGVTVKVEYANWVFANSAKVLYYSPK